VSTVVSLAANWLLFRQAFMHVLRRWGWMQGLWLHAASGVGALLRPLLTNISGAIEGGHAGPAVNKWSFGAYDLLSTLRKITALRKLYLSHIGIDGVGPMVMGDSMGAMTALLVYVMKESRTLLPILPSSLDCNSYASRTVASVMMGPCVWHLHLPS
jgi:hypothetical protein